MMDLFDLKQPSASIEISQVLTILKTVRIRQAGLPELEIHDELCTALDKHGMPYRREYPFGPRCRADLWVDGIVIEVKKQRPARAALLNQLTRYASQPGVRAIITVLERSIPLPATLNDKPVAIVSLNTLWGIAL
ncbi:hypothetical protein [Chromobacterium haemolyticum]|uniref:hypothetical protein n=1 Tax=Chromobacterium haemolyticum TaxID=394935 RepID=UPI00244706F4|nr:hypothetical protein [Chromobacterium haemolyticum]MDH0342084.1 hypothetical protein [Chromobacterium haemolyticum]